MNDHEYLRRSILDEVARTVDERAHRLAQVENIGIIPSAVFGAPSAECIDLFRDGHFYGCISLVQAVTEAIVRHVWQIKLVRKNSAEGNFESNVRELHKKQFISDEIKDKLDLIWDERHTFHHLRLNVATARDELEDRASNILRLLAEVEDHFFGGEFVADGRFRPRFPEYWNIEPNGEALVYVRTKR